MKEIENRRSIRKYKDTEVSHDDILKMIDAARLAPSGSNTQPWRYLIIKDDTVKQAIAKIDHNQSWMLTAPIFIICIADIRCRIEGKESLCCDEESSIFELKQIIRDSSVSIGYMLLEAEHLGLGTCWTGWYNQSDIKKVLNLPSYLYVNGIVTVGYADECPKARPRKTIEQILSFDKVDVLK